MKSYSVPAEMLVKGFLLDDAVKERDPATGWLHCHDSFSQMR